ncbi:hypothetical protein INT46_008154 [Mucor plumbeus]|uniref:Uncharacterized protein n=1 Tax=Mucor plumbeus TaxID=97098 RepID=A0A8H7RPA6_9FUNG|nr:hypothetical protein INT46_008154 [Mucor plumbeus]
MSNPYLNISDANEPNNNSDRFMPSSHSLENQHTTIITPEKHLLYVEDYDTMPPSYSVAQQDHCTSQSSVVDNSFRANEAIPMNTYNDTSTEPELETAFLMTESTEEDNHYKPTAPLMNQMELDFYNSDNNIKTKPRWTLFRKFLAFSIFAIGITLMSAILATFDCYNSCKEKDNCDKCPKVTREGFTAFGYITFILGSMVIMGKVAQRIIS